MMRRQMKLAAVLVVVVLALTGFSTTAGSGKSKSRSGKSSSSGGGCSNSKKSNNGYRGTHDDDHDDDYDSSSSGSSGSSETPAPTASDDVADVRVIRCAAPREGKRKAVTSSLIEVRANNPYTQEYEIDVRFVDARGNTVDTADATATLDTGEFRTLTVRMESPGKVSRVKRCEVTAKVV